jgi:hypothetical protein
MCTDGITIVLQPYCNVEDHSVARERTGKHPAPEYTQGNNGRCISVEECYCALLGNGEPMKTLARNHVTFLCGSPYATRELGFLCVVRVEAT